MTGKKYDEGKIRAGLVLGDFAAALEAVSLVGTFGAQKYSDSNWLMVDNAQERYDDAMLRHWLEDKISTTSGKGSGYDSESGILHIAHVAWNALAVLELELRSDSRLLKRIPNDECSSR